MHFVDTHALVGSWEKGPCVFYVGFLTLLPVNK